MRRGHLRDIHWREHTRSADGKTAHDPRSDSDADDYLGIVSDRVVEVAPPGVTGGGDLVTSYPSTAGVGGSWTATTNGGSIQAFATCQAVV